MRELLDRSLAEVRLDAGIKHLERISVAQFIEDVEVGALIQAQARGVHLDVRSIEPAVTIEGDRQILEAAVSNLLQNAFKFTRKGGNVSLNVRATQERVLFEIEDECGGLPPGNPEDLFRAFEQKGTDRSGVGLGLAICRKAAKANAGSSARATFQGKAASSLWTCRGRRRSRIADESKRSSTRKAGSLAASPLIIKVSNYASRRNSLDA